MINTEHNILLLLHIHIIFKMCLKLPEYRIPGKRINVDNNYDQIHDAKFWGSCSNVHKHSSLLRQESMSIGKSLMMFQRSLLLQWSGTVKPLDTNINITTNLFITCTALVLVSWCISDIPNETECHHIATSNLICQNNMLHNLFVFVFH
jgi:hypothetical protein